MVYLQRIPAAPLAGFVRVLWYAQIPDVAHRRERILPNGCVQVILSLARDFLLDCPEGQPDLPTPPAVIVGARSVYEIVAVSDMADLIGVVFEPGGFGCFASDAVDLFSNRSVPVEDVWGAPAQDLRRQLRGTPTAAAKLELMENFLAHEICAAAHAEQDGGICAAPVQTSAGRCESAGGGEERGLERAPPISGFSRGSRPVAQGVVQDSAFSAGSAAIARGRGCAMGRAGARLRLL